MNAHLPKPDPKTLPARRLGRPEDVAGPVVFLCSDRSNYITGIELPINGGQLFYP
jgi:NAD(P)-dependent dehydrogenase (short-subunit alcohol dehydrogenase family)